ncbi:ATP-binding protein [Streptomyces noursei]|uniref:ATP-binding protein n=1 Tax=Streptomyces noursei TaxID=1971 RepID=UPI0023B79A48|nr:ATP-binding protein [Streptomyces noursei]
MAANQIRLSVASTPVGASSARRQLVNRMREWADVLDQQVLDNAELVVAELLVNAVQHAGGGPIAAGARLGDDGLLIEVIDTSPVFPALGLPSMDAENGRGLLLVSALADRHGVEPVPPGKRCWAQFKVGAPLPAIS